MSGECNCIARVSDLPHNASCPAAPCPRCAKMEARVEKLEAAIYDNVSALDLSRCQYRELTGELTLKEDDWGAVEQARKELSAALNKGADDER